MSFFIHIDNFNSNDCLKGGQHDEKGSVLMYRTRKGEVRYINENKYYIPGSGELTGFPMIRKVHRRMHIVGGSVACSKCGTPYIESHNPYL